MNQYPNDADIAGIQAGKASAPIGKPLVASEVPWPTAITPPTAATAP
jgi:penicillin-binding protein 2